MSNYNPEEIKSLISNSNEPLLFKNLISSDLVKWSLEEWAEKLKDDILEFRVGKLEYTNDPQWETKCNVIKSHFKYFLQHSKYEEHEWLYFDYKYLEKWFTDVKELRKNITWAPLGFPNITVDDSTIWIGTKGAHTPCHIDTYGFNLIFQVFGRKLWIVAPPEENLKPSRVPYEESSIYSKLNFFSPNPKDFKGVNNCRKIILNPGEVLYLPHKWWHYVENLETAISINTWIPMPEDDEERLGESIVQFFVKQMVGMSDDSKTVNYILNPNMRQTVLENDHGYMLETITRCKNICKDKLQSKKSRKQYSEDNKSDEKINEKEIMDKYSFIEKIPKLSQEDFITFLEEQSSRFKSTSTDNDIPEKIDIVELLDTFIDNDVVSLIREKLLSK